MCVLTYMYAHMLPYLGTWYCEIVIRETAICLESSVKICLGLKKYKLARNKWGLVTGWVSRCRKSASKNSFWPMQTRKSRHYNKDHLLPILTTLVHLQHMKSTLLVDLLLNSLYHLCVGNSENFNPNNTCYQTASQYNWCNTTKLYL